MSIPDGLRTQFILTNEQLKNELNLMTDHFTDWVLAPLGIPPKNQVVSSISRLVVDMERFADDSLEVMADIGMGVVYKNGSQLQTIRRNLSDSERKTLIETYYNFHHQQLEALTEFVLQSNECAVIVDVHSYPQIALPYERDHTLRRPEICIGTSEYHTPTELEMALVEAFQHAGFDVGINTPFAGTLIPSKYWNKNNRVIGFMLEIRRDVYMDESSFTLSGHSEHARHKICHAIETAMDKFFNEMEDK